MTLEDTITQIAPFVVTYVLGHIGSIGLQKLRSNVHNFRGLVDNIDNALNDPNVNDAQFKAIWDSSKTLLRKA